ncbi:MAG: M50 family metallopeptidase [Planctomycetales bacterium]|nr:M50 family metallopeptidase [Planctomycetales bacterium]
MDRIRQVLFLASALALCWLLMQIVHEAGHVLGAWLTGARVERVVLHPLAISRTDVSRNLHPGVVAWLGPVVGALAPCVAWQLMPRRWPSAVAIAGFFAGFCLLANGLYLSVGVAEGIGDCGDLMRHGTPARVLVAIGVAASLAGLLIWHRLGSPLALFTAKRLPSWSAALGCALALAGLAAAEIALS